MVTERELAAGTKVVPGDGDGVERFISRADSRRRARAGSSGPRTASGGKAGDGVGKVIGEL